MNATPSTMSPNPALDNDCDDESEAPVTVPAKNPRTLCCCQSVACIIFDASPLGLTQQCQQALLLGNSLDLWSVTFRRRLGGGHSGCDLAPGCRTRLNAPLLGCGGLTVSGLRDGRG